MFDLDGPKLLLLAVVALVAIGPKELPGAIRTGMSWMRKTRSLAREFQSGIEELSREAGVQDLRHEVETAASSENFDSLTRDLHGAVADDETRKILEDPDTKKLLAEIESDNYFAGSPGEEEPPRELAADELEKSPEAPPGATGS